MSIKARHGNLATLPPLSTGAHYDVQDGMNVLEAVSYVAGAPFSIAPACACPVLGILLLSWNETLRDGERDKILRPLIPLLIGTRSTQETESRRATMASDWVIREYTPAWLRVAGLTAHADALAGLPEISNVAECSSLLPALKAARRDADAARAATSASTGESLRGRINRSASIAYLWAEAGVPSHGASMAAVFAFDPKWKWDEKDGIAWDARAARDEATSAALTAIKVTAEAAAWSATGGQGNKVKGRLAKKAVNAPWAALRPTRIALQQSALALVHRMIRVEEAM